MDKTEHNTLPAVASDYIDAVIKSMRYRKKIRQEVRQELTDHFTDALADCQNDDQRQTLAAELIAEFGDAKLLGTLLRRGKKRCRPLWQKVFLAIVKTADIILLLCLLRVGYMASGRPVISVDYAQWMNSQVRAGRDESQNAYHDYQKASELIAKEFPPEIKRIELYPSNQQKTSEDWQAIETFLKTQTAAIEAFRTGAVKPYYWNKYESKPLKEDETHSNFSTEITGEFTAGVVAALMSKLSGDKRIARAISEFQIPLAIHQGNLEQAVDDSIALYRFGHHLSSQGVAIEQLVGMAIKGLAMAQIQDLLRQVELSPENLSRFHQVIEMDYDPAIAEMDLGLEKAFWYEQIQRYFTDDGKGNGRPLPMGVILSSSGDYKDFIKGFVTGFPDRKEATALIDYWFMQFYNYRKLTPASVKSLQKSNGANTDFIFIEKNSTVPPIMMNVVAPAIQKTVAISWRVRSGQAGLLGTLAVLRFEKDNTRLPESLEELKQKGYLQKMPMNPYSDKPLVYKKTDDGFMLYSVGMDFKDDGGAPSTDNNGKPRQWGENGDWIFWPQD